VFQNKLDDVQVAWDRNAISPGTPFMDRIRAYIQGRIRNREDTMRNYHFSSADDAGEGEHKIFQQIRGLPQDSRVIVHGLDADLIMLSLLSHHLNVHLMREDEDDFQYLSVSELRRALLIELKSKYGWPNHEEDRTIIETYITLCFLLGNDFLPHMPCLHLKHHGHERLLHAAAPTLSENGYPDSDWQLHRMMTDVLFHLSKDEDKTMFSMTEKYLKSMPRGATTLASDLYAIQPQNKDPLATIIYTLPQTERWRQYYYKHMFHTRMHDTAVILNVCRTYIQGIHWVLRYYKRLANDPMWHYPWGYAPSLRDLANFSAGLSCDDFQAMLGTFCTPPDKGFVDPITQLLCIMPLESAPILPKVVRDVMSKKARGATHLFPEKYAIQTFLKTHLWECTPVLPHLDIPVLTAAIKRAAH
jgi:5'-3' exoribonuclease 1